MLLSCVNIKLINSKEVILSVQEYNSIVKNYNLVKEQSVVLMINGPCVYLRRFFFIKFTKAGRQAQLHYHKNLSKIIGP